mmetsp:Transcript_4402/g.5089  ORF Transcript_4402/g.5089 Transcript_4402/m.5089 type:complete len:81 (-) Transcript_4402:447-689(-)|eukprot:CAMPEP_0194135586 /NCGR_PEP_ID=MMETSP0152-20130528/5685_1 /TAXON_ID=1049557 /ORGANISM="Thalassiothrix antarctica, Strain L6-D1" /LENGTH=80 /DNA_ID=CAMNT_0038831899 /DNA_START=149 /DNA_END=391 /DNA_ORIENTATION=-
MAEVSGITELQLLNQEVNLLKKELDDIESAAENTSTACDYVAANVQKQADQDGFVLTEGGEHNRFHGSGPSDEGACCVLL